MLFRETGAVYSENHAEHTNTLCGQNAEFSLLRQVTRIKPLGFKGLRIQFSKIKYILLLLLLLLLLLVGRY
jgi:hypothetical protein